MITQEAKAIFNSVLKSTLLAQSGLYFVGQVLQKAGSFLLIPVWTYYLVPADYGVVGAMSAYSNLLHIVLMLGVYGSVVRHLYEFKEKSAEQKSYVFSNFVFLSAFSGAALITLWFFGERWWSFFSSGNIPFKPFVTVTLLSVWAGLISRMLLSLYQAQQRVGAYVVIEGLGFVLSVIVGLVLVVQYRMGAYGQILGGFVSQVALMIIAAILVFRDWFTPRMAWRHVYNALIFGLPLVPHLLSGWALTFIDRIMLEHFVPLREVGFYNLGYNLGMGMLVLVTSINQAYQPYYYELMRSDVRPEKRILKIVSWYVAGVGLVTLFGSLFAGELIRILTPEKYQSAAVFVPPIVLSYFLVGLYYFVGSPLFYFKKTKLLPVITGAAAILNIVLNLLLIPQYGAIAAAWTTLVSYGAMLVLYYIVARKLSAVRYPMLRYGTFIGILIFVVIVVTPSLELSIGKLLTKLTFCGVFALLAYVFLIRYQAPRDAST